MTAGMSNVVRTINKYFHFNGIKANKNFILLSLMIVLSCVSQILAVMKSSMVAGFFGTSTEIDAYNFANSLVSFFFGFFSAGISTIIIPSYVRNINNREIFGFLTLIYVFLFLVTILCILFRLPIISIITNREDEFIVIAANSLIILFLSSFLSSIAYITTSFFQCIDRYNTPKVINLVSQVIVVLLLLFIKNISIYKYAIIVSVGVFVNFVFDTLIALKYGWRIRFDFNFTGGSTFRLIKLFLPIVLSTGIYRISLLVDSTLASRLSTGKITILSYSNLIASLVHSVVIGNLLIYLYPKIVSKIKDNNNQKLFWNQTICFHSIVCLIIAGFSCCGLDGIALLFEHGKFNASATISVFYGSLIYIVGQQSSIIRDLIYRYFYAKGNTKTSAKNSLVAGVSNIVISLVLVKLIGFYGIIVGTALASFISLITILYRFGVIIGYESSLKNIILSYLVNILICISTVLIVNATSYVSGIDSHAIKIFLFGIESLVVYIFLTAFFNRSVITTFVHI